MNDQLLLEWIQSCITANRFSVTEHAQVKHPLQEGFKVREAVMSILYGSVVSHRAQDSRCVICSQIPGMELRPEYHGSFIHCVVKYDDVTHMVIITMYRPRIDEWETPQRRIRS